MCFEFNIKFKLIDDTLHIGVESQNNKVKKKQNKLI